MSSPSAVVCREIFDENSQPSAEEISEYAAQLGIDPDSESHLLPLARDGLMQALPAHWKAYYDDKIQSHYYYNEDTKKTQWEHPLDNVYRELVKKARDASVLDDTCASVQELPTSEDYTKNLERVETKVESDEELSTDSENQAADLRDNQALISGRRLTPLGRPPPSPLARLDKKLSDTRISPLRRSVDSSLTNKPGLIRNSSDRDLLSRSAERPKLLFKQQSEIIDLKMHVLNSPEEENFSPLLIGSKFDKGLPLTGKGNMFLKVSKPDFPSPDTDKSVTLDSVTKSDPPKGILREKLSDTLHKKVDSIMTGRLKQPSSFEEDRKSVRFKLENLPDPTLSPGSNSSSEQNDAQSSIISAAPTVPSNNIVLSPRVISSPIITPSSPVISQVPLNQIVLTPLSTRPPLPPRPSDSPRDTKSLSMSERDSVDITSPGAPPSPIKLSLPTPLPRILSPLKPDPLPIKITRNNLGHVFKSITTKNFVKSDSNSDSEESESHNRGSSPRRRVLRPPPGDYIKPDLFQKNFQKISDLVRPGDIETTSVNLEEPVFSDKESRPRSPMIPQQNKISINLMESIESETSIDSPDREFANLDLNDLDDSNDKDKQIEYQEKSASKDEEIIEKANSERPRSESIPIPQIKVPSLDFSKSLHSESEESKRTSIEEPKFNKSYELPLKSPELSIKSPQIRVSPTPSLGSEIRSPRLDYSKPWSPLSTFKPLNKVVSPQLKNSDSGSSLAKGMTSPRLDGVILSQGKSSSDNVVVVYQFETQEETSPKLIKSPLMPDMGTRDMMERNKADERRRLELALQKELESIRVESSIRERKLRAELQEELREAEEKFSKEKKVRLNEQAVRHRREMEEALSTMEHNHKQSLEKATTELAKRYQRDIEMAEKQHIDNMNTLQLQYKQKLLDRQQILEIENERALSELREQFQANLTKEKSRMIEENKATIDSLRDEHTARITELRHDYRAEVERLRTQHACHLEEIRSRLASERAASGRLNDERALQEKYKCLKEKYVRLKHDVKMSIERRNKRREMSMTTGSETEKSNSHKATQSLERCKEINETLVTAVVEPVPMRLNNNTNIKYNDNETSYSESNPHKNYDNNNDDWKLRRENTVPSADTSQASAVKPQRPHRRTAVAFREPPHKSRDRDRDVGATTDCQDSSDATTADDKPRENVNGHTRRRCFTRLKSASTSRLNYSPKRGEGWSSPLESLRQQLRKLDDLEDQFPDLALQPAYSLRYPFPELVIGSMMSTQVSSISDAHLQDECAAVSATSGPQCTPGGRRHRCALVLKMSIGYARNLGRHHRSYNCGVSSADAPELEFVRHRALVEREGMRRARAALKRRSAALRDSRAAALEPSGPSEEREVTELEVALHRARALLGEKEIRLRHIERALRRLADAHPPPLIQEANTSDASSGSEAVPTETGGAVLRSLRALHADVRDIWRALDARRPYTASPETSSCNPPTTSQTRMTLSAPEPIIQEISDGGVAEKARGLRAWLQTAP